MRLVVTDRLRQYILGLGVGLAEIIRRAEGVGKHSIYAAMRGDTSVLNDRTAEALAKGLGTTTDELLRISLGMEALRGEVPADVPDEVATLARRWKDLDQRAQGIIMAVLRTAVPAGT